MFNGKGLTVTSTSPGTIAVSNGTNSVTMPGVSINLSGAVSVQGGAGVQLVRHPNGDVTVAANPTVASGPTKPSGGAQAGPPGVTAADNFKELGKVAGNGLATVAVSPVAVVAGAGVIVGGALAGIVKDTPSKRPKRSRTTSCRMWRKLSSGLAAGSEPSVRIFTGDRSSVARFLVSVIPASF